MRREAGVGSGSALSICPRISRQGTGQEKHWGGQTTTSLTLSGVDWETKVWSAFECFLDMAQIRISVCPPGMGLPFLDEETYRPDCVQHQFDNLFLLGSLLCVL